MSSPPVTELLVLAREGDSLARERLARWVEQIVRRRLVASCQSFPDAQRDVTDVVSAVFLKLLKADSLGAAPNRRYLAVTTARAVRHVLVDEARRRNAIRRGAHFTRHGLESVLDQLAEKHVDILPLSESLELLANQRPRQAEVVDLRFFGGHTNGEIADLLGVSVAAVQSDWTAARNWLFQRLQ
jgi:RNA polymerase sigma factor (TIGR02999 family)